MRAIAASLIVSLFGAAFLWHATDGLQALTAESARRLSAARQMPAVPDLGLETMSGRFEPLRPAGGRAAVVTFIYTTCPTICQSTGTDVARLRDRFQTKGLGDRVRIVSISFDPDRDTVREMARYGEAHDADGIIWTIARPSKKDLPRLLEGFGVVVIPNAFDGYEHNAAYHIISPAGRLTAIVDMEDITGAVAATEKALR